MRADGQADRQLIFERIALAGWYNHFRKETKEMSNLHRDRQWRARLDELIREQNVDLEFIADYIGAPYNGSETVFYAKVPKKRTRFIGIGMALRQPLEQINQWILDYSSHRRLYVKDVADDLIWIYLIGLNQSAEEGAANYFRMFEECQEAALMIYTQLWDEITLGSIDTSDLEMELERISYDDTFQGLRQFIIDHMDSFKTAYARPRRMLDRYLDCILNPDGSEAGGKTLNSLRGYLDDSMINYLSGDSETVHTMDRRKPVRKVTFKTVPKNRKTHISLCLALGMTRGSIDQYLELMGYAPLREKGEEGQLIEMLAGWERKRPLQEAYRKACFEETAGPELTGEQKQTAVQEMLNLRRDLHEEYKKRGLVFPYS